MRDEPDGWCDECGTDHVHEVTDDERWGVFARCTVCGAERWFQTDGG